MKIKVFFLFPESDDDIVRIADCPDAYENLIAEVLMIKQQLKSNIKYELCYDSSNIKLFLEKSKSFLDDVYILKYSNRLQTFFNNCSRNIGVNNLIKSDCKYFNWNINNTSNNESNTLIAEATESILNQANDHKTILINISRAHKTNRECIHVIIDAIHYNELPQLVTIPIVNNEIEFSEWVLTLPKASFSLKDKRLFQLTKYKWEKQSIYYDIKNGNFWYYDYFHKENKKHYEVFDQNGIHLGEANIFGILDRSKACNSKKIGHIIH